MGAALVNLAFAIVPFTLLALIDRVVISWTWFYMLIPSLQIALLTAGVSLIIASVAVFFSDTIEMYMVFLNAFMYFTPIMYPVEALPPILRLLEEFNPVHHILRSARGAIIEHVLPSPESILIGTALSLGVFVIGWVWFARTQDQFAYYI